MSFASLPPELVVYLLEYFPTPSLAAICLVSHELHDVALPILYSHLDCQSLASTLVLFRSLLRQDAQDTYIAKYSGKVRSISVPTRPATHEVKAAIALALAQCIGHGWFPALKNLYWPFTYVRRGFLDERDAAAFDEQLWEAMNARYNTFGRLDIQSTLYQIPASAIWQLASKCEVFFGHELPSWSPELDLVARPHRCGLGQAGSATLLAVLSEQSSRARS